MAMGCIDCHDYMDGYNSGKREGTLEELEEMKTKLQNLFTTSVCGDTPYYNANMVDEILNKRISELKEQTNKATLLDIEGACELTDDNIKKYVYTKEDIVNKLKKLKAEIEKSLDEIDEKMYKLIGYKEVIVKEDE